MNEENQCCDACAVKTGEAKGSSLDRMVRRFWNGLCRWCFLNIWCRHCYRHVMRMLHRFNLHYAPPSMMSPRYGQRDHWCQWCGLRGHTWTHDPNAPLSPNIAVFGSGSLKDIQTLCNECDKLRKHNEILHAEIELLEKAVKFKPKLECSICNGNGFIDVEKYDRVEQEDCHWCGTTGIEPQLPMPEAAQ